MRVLQQLQGVRHRCGISLRFTCSDKFGSLHVVSRQHADTQLALDLYEPCEEPSMLLMAGLLQAVGVQHSVTQYWLRLVDRMLLDSTPQLLRRRPVGRF